MAETKELTREIRDRRIAVAKDVKLQHAANNFRIGFSYLAIYDDDEVSSAIAGTRDAPPTDLKDVVDQVSLACGVCARGALLLSKARLFNDVPIASVFETDEGWVNSIVDQDGTANLLSDTFDVATLARIEAAFEVSGALVDASIEGGLDVDAEVAWGRLYMGSKDGRLLAIMDNIIANDGEFIVPSTAQA